jgi:hypothetical protein
MLSQMEIDDTTEAQIRLVVGTITLTLGFGYLSWILKGTMLMGSALPLKQLSRNFDPIAPISRRVDTDKPKRIGMKISHALILIGNHQRAIAARVLRRHPGGTLARVT